MKEKELEVIVKNTGLRRKFPVGATLREIAAQAGVKMPHPVVGALVNNSVKELDYMLFRPKMVEFIDVTSQPGYRMYTRSLSFILVKACRNLYPERRLLIEHSVSKGYFCQFADGRGATDAEIDAIKAEMRRLVDLDLPFEREEMLTDDAIALFKEHGYDNKVRLLMTRESFYSIVNWLDGTPDFFYGHLLPSTGYAATFGLERYYDGILLRLPNRLEPSQLEPAVAQDKMFEILQEHKSWNKVIVAHNLGLLNKATIEGRISDLIMVAEALQEKKIAHIADMIAEREHRPRVILISGPSSSGKTTTAKRLGVQLQVLGIAPKVISMDDYFVDREKTPLDENGAYDFENIEAVDLALFNEHLVTLLAGGEVELPRFSFETGKRYYDGARMRLEANQALLIEGIHALNPRLTSKIDDRDKFRLYVSALTSLSIDDHNRIPTTDNRLLRRIVRDHRYRGYSAMDTIGRWESVRRGEEKYIFPFQENADVMYNSALVFELGVLKPYVEPVLREVPASAPEYTEAKRLLKFLSYVRPIPEKNLPPTSILREFLFGSSFHYS